MFYIETRPITPTACSTGYRVAEAQGIAMGVEFMEEGHPLQSRVLQAVGVFCAVFAIAALVHTVREVPFESDLFWQGMEGRRQSVDLICCANNCMLVPSHDSGFLGYFTGLTVNERNDPSFPRRAILPTRPVEPLKNVVSMRPLIEFHNTVLSMRSSGF